MKIGIIDFRGLRAIVALSEMALHRSKTLISGLFKQPLREEVILLKGTVCALNMPDICESKGKPLHPSEVEVDHIIPRTRFKDLTKADSMDNLQPVCTPCHRAKTKSDLRVLSRMR